MSTNTAIKTWQERYNENGGSVEDCANAEIAELRAALERTQHELWCAGVNLDGANEERAELRAALEAEQPAAQQGDGELPPGAVELAGEDLFVPLALDLRSAQGGEEIKHASQALLDWHNEQVRAAIAQRADSGEAKPVAYLRFRAAQQWSGNGNHDVENAEWLETCHAHEVGDDKLPAFPVYCAPLVQPDSERDAARMDWLEKRVVSVYQEPRHGAGFMFAASHTGYDRSGPNLRKLTDAAMAAQQGEKK